MLCGNPLNFVSRYGINVFAISLQIILRQIVKMLVDDEVGQAFLSFSTASSNSFAWGGTLPYTMLPKSREGFLLVFLSLFRLVRSIE